MRSLSLVICVVVLQSTASGDDWYHQRSCEAPCAPPCYRPCPPPTAREQAGPPEEYYVAPPPTGEYQGASDSTGIRFGSIRIPEITIPFPTFQMPSLQRFHREPEIHTDRMTAGLQAGPVLDTQIARPQAREQAGPPEEAVPQAGPPECQQPVWQCPCDRCVQLRRGSDGRIDGLERQISQLQGLVEQLTSLQMQQGGIRQSNFQQAPSPAPQSAAPAGPMDPQQSFGTQPATGYQSAADVEAQRRQAEVERQNAEYQHKCHEVDQLKAQVAEMQRQYQLMLEMQQNEVFRQREERLRNQLTEQPAQPASLVRPAPATGHPRPMPGGYSTPVREDEPRAAAGRSIFEQLTNPQTAFTWQNQVVETGDARLSSLSR